MTIPPRPAIPVPPELTASQIEEAIVAALIPTARELTPGQAIADRALSATVLGYRSIAGAPSWYLESRTPGTIYAGYDRGRHYMRVGIDYTPTAITLRIVEARDLDYDGTHLHKNALVWVDELERRVRQSLGGMELRRITDEP